MELQTKQPPELEFSMPEVEESLTAYLSAIGGAIIGLLLTLLILAIWNGGTLNFTNTSKVNALEAGLTAVAADLETVNTGVDALGERLVVMEQEAGVVVALQKNLATLDSSLNDLSESLSDQGIQISELDTAVADLQVTRRNFDLFTAALAEALARMEAGSALAPQSTEASAPAQGSESAAKEGQAAPAADSPGVAPERSSTISESSAAPLSEQAQLSSAFAEPTVVVSAEVAPDALQVYLYVDANEDGAFDSNENLLAGAAVSLTAPSDEAVSPAESGETAGTLFVGLAAGAYVVAVEDARGYALAVQQRVTVNVDPEAEAGQVIYFAVLTAPGG